VHSPEVEQADRERMANILTDIAQHTPAANARNWCLTRALELRGTIDLTRYRQHRLHKGSILSADPTRFVAVLRVMLDPHSAQGVDCHLAWHFSNGARAGLHVRRGVAVPTDGQGADIIMGLSHETWADVASGAITLSAAIYQGILSLDGPEPAWRRFFAAFDHVSLNS